jgi:hypothetical protein
MPACSAPGRLVDAEIRRQSADGRVGRNFAKMIERPFGVGAGSLFGRLPAGRWPRHFLRAGSHRSRPRVVGARPRRYLDRQPYDIGHQMGDRDDQQDQTKTNALRHVLLLLLQAT